MHELYKRHRPKLLKHLVGQPEATKMVSTWVRKGKVPHTILFTGPSGCGKTTIARILTEKMLCSRMDFQELNCADFRGVDMVREIRSRVGLAPIDGPVRVWLIDEVHQLTKDAQNAFLKLLEDTPAHVYFFLATTESGKLLRTIVTRCSEVKVRALTNRELEELIGRVCSKEGVKLGEELVERIAEVADGSARKALVIVDQVIGIDDDEERLQAIENADARRAGIEIARALINPRTRWADMVPILKGVDEEPESLRRMVLGYASSVMLGSNRKLADRAALIVSVFRDHWYDCGRAGLIVSCWEILNSK